jgi:hypothetical protein
MDPLDDLFEKLDVLQKQYVFTELPYLNFSEWAAIKNSARGDVNSLYANFSIWGWDKHFRDLVQKEGKFRISRVESIHAFEQGGVYCSEHELVGFPNADGESSYWHHSTKGIPLSHRFVREHRPENGILQYRDPNNDYWDINPAMLRRALLDVASQVDFNLSKMIELPVVDVFNVRIEMTDFTKIF